MEAASSSFDSFFTTYGIREEQQYMRFYHGSRQEHTASDLQNSAR